MSIDFGTGGADEAERAPSVPTDPSSDTPVSRSPRWVPAAIAAALAAGIAIGVVIGLLLGSDDQPIAATTTIQVATTAGASAATSQAPATTAPVTTTAAASDQAPVGAVGAFGPVELDGPALRRYADGSADTEIGTPVPSISGIGLDGEPLVIPMDDGRAKLVMFVAHWCPHCQNELPLVREWLATTTLPDNVDFYTVATLTDPERDNFPPGPWFAAEDWEWPVLLDDEGSTAAAAVGLNAVPFWAVIEADGTLAARGAGELPTESLDSIVERLASGPDGDG